VRAVQEPRRLGRAGSASPEAIRPAQVRVGGGRMQSGAFDPRLGSTDGTPPRPPWLDAVIICGVRFVVIALPAA
jgi:hypothetical protein